MHLTLSDDLSDETASVLSYKRSSAQRLACLSRQELPNNRLQPQAQPKGVIAEQHLKDGLLPLDICKLGLLQA